MRFSHVLLGFFVTSALWVTWQMLFILSESQDERWSLLWTFDAFWHILYFAVLCTICMLWSPSKNNLQYAYMDELVQDPGEEGETEEGDTASADGDKRGA